jgi:outer membrane receptor protein involved in Fe transport
MDNKINQSTLVTDQQAPMRKKRLALMVSAVLGTAPAAVQVNAQDNTLEEVIVTASKRKSNLQDLPQAITAFTTADIERQGFNVLDDYAGKIPSLAFARREPAGTSLVFRGVASSGIQFGTKPSAGIYLDEQPITQAGLNPDPRLIDIERVEALSGPQGTLFGDATQSGTLRIITNKPDTTEMSGWIEGTAAYVEDSDDQDTDISAMINIPLMDDKLAIRLVGFSSEDAGYIDNVLGSNQKDQYAANRVAAGLPLGQPFDNSDQVDDDINSASTVGGRAALRWFVNEDWTVDIAGIMQNTDVDGFGDTNDFVGEREQVRFEDEELSDDWYQLSLTIEGNLGFADTVLTGSYFNRDMTYEADATDYQFDFDQAYDPTYIAPGYYYAATIYDFTGTPRGYAVQDQEDERWTVEGRLTTPADSDSRWSGLIGFFYSKLEREQLFTSTVRNFSDTDYYANLGYYYLNTAANSPFDPEYDYGNPNYATFHNTGSDNWFFGAYDLDVEQKAVFGEVTFDATEKLSFTAGARWFDHEEDFKLQQGDLLEGKQVDEQRDYLYNNEDNNYSEDDWVPKLNVTYSITDDIMTYATYSEGFRSGGTNALRASSVLPDSYESDKLKNYELGFKSTWLENTLRFNIVAYYMQWDDMQIQVNDPGSFGLGIVNFSEAEVTGFEGEITWLPAVGWDVSANFAAITAEISDDNEIYGSDGQLVATVSDGTDLPITPDSKASIAVEYNFQSQLLGADPYMRLDWSYTGDSVNSLDGTESIVFTQGPTDQPSYDIGNFRMGLDAEQWSSTLYVSNITDEVAEQFYNNRWGSRQRLSINKPRTIGLTLRWKF